MAEHDLLRAQMRRARTAARNIEAVATAIRAHIERESRAVYPVCECLFGGRDGAVAVVRQDHGELEARLREISAQAANARGPRLVARLEGFAICLEDHFSREERVLFPLMDALLTGNDTARLAERLRASDGG